MIDSRHTGHQRPAGRARLTCLRPSVQSRWRISAWRKCASLSGSPFREAEKRARKWTSRRPVQTRAGHRGDGCARRPRAPWGPHGGPPPARRATPRRPRAGRRRDRRRPDRGRRPGPRRRGRPVPRRCGRTRPARPGQRHQHLDKTCIGDALRPGRWPGWAGCPTSTAGPATTYDVAADRASRVVERALAHGTTRMRAFADVEAVAGTTGTQALVALRERWAGEVELQVAVFPQDLLYADAGGEARLEAAIEAGADVVGGLPAGEATTERMRAHVDFCLDLARRRDADAHLLIDDSDDPVAAQPGVPRAPHDRRAGRGASPPRTWARSPPTTRPTRATSSGSWRDAGISVCSNPQISLLLHGRDDRGLVRRGTTRVRELLDAGVTCWRRRTTSTTPTCRWPRRPARGRSFVAHVCQLAWPEELETVMDMISVNAARAMRVDDGYGLQRRPRRPRRRRRPGRPDRRRRAAAAPLRHQPRPARHGDRPQIRHGR